MPDTATPLRTDWVAIGTAGDTIDGRVISEQDIQDMASTYSTHLYGARINWEHYPAKWFGAFGDVHALKAEKTNIPNIGERLQLFAILEPDKKLIDMNSQGEGVYPSMEIWPNFAKTGKAYLTGLAATDQPASIGTQRWKFSQKEDQAILFSNVLNTPMDLSVSQQTEAANQTSFTEFLNQFKALFNQGTNDQENQETMNQVQFDAFQKKQNQNFSSLADGINKLTTAITNNFTNSCTDNNQQNGDESAGQNSANQNGDESAGQNNANQNADNDTGNGAGNENLSTNHSNNDFAERFSKVESKITELTKKVEVYGAQDAPGQSDNPPGGNTARFV